MSLHDFPRSERVRRLRDQAEELRDRATQARDPEVRLSYLELARSWKQTAERVEGREAETPPDVAPKAPRGLTH